MEMARILDFNGNEADRTVMVASLIELKAQNVQVAQVTASSAHEAAAAEASGIEMVVCMSEYVPAVRRGLRECSSPPPLTSPGP